MLGPYVKALIAHKMALDAVPPGGGLHSAITFLKDPKRILETARAATKWVEQAIAVVRTASPPNPYVNADDETIAKEILRQAEEKQKRQKQGLK